MSRDADTASVPDKAALATVLSYLKTKNLKETAEVLKKELGLAGDGGLETLPSSSTLHGSSVGLSGTEPEKYEESYASHVSCSTAVTSLSAGVQLKGLAPDQSTMSTTTAVVTTSDYEDDGNDSDTSSDDEDEDENDVDDEIDDQKKLLQSQEDISTMEASSSSNSHAPPQSLSLLPLLQSQRRQLQTQQQNGGSWAESTTTTTTNADSKANGNDEEEEYSDDDEDGSNIAATPRLTPTQFVFTTKNPFTSQPVPVPAAAAAAVAVVPSPTLSSTPSSVDRSPSWLQSKQPLTFPPPPLVSSSGVSAAAISELISSASFSPSSSSSSPPPGQLPLKVPSLQQQLRQHQQLVLAGGVSATSTTTASAVVQGEVVNSSTTPISSPPPAALGAAQLAINAGAAPFIYQLAAPAQHVGIRQSVLTPILTFLPNAQSLVAAAAGRQVGSAIPQPVILSPPGHALSVPLTSTASPALVSSLTAAAKVTNGVSLPQQQPLQQKSIIEQSLGLAQQTHQVLSTEPTTGQQTLSSPVVDLVTSTARNGSPPRTLASIPLSEMTPQYSELKAFAEEFKNKRIRLGFTQGAVGQSLADKGYSNFAQSTISRFEQMQLSPTNAAAIKLVLEKWLQETENPEAAHSPSSSSPLMASRKRKRRAVFTPQTKTTLETYFKQNPRPNRHVIESVAHELDLLPEEVRVWFCNKRQKEKQGNGGGCAPTAVAYKYPYERESSVSLSSSGANSPCSMYESSSASSVFPKRNTPSPPRNTTPFTIEELSKSSSTSTKTISSPMCIAASPFATSPQGVVMALTTPRISFTAQPAAAVTSPPATVILPQLRVSQTTA